MATPTLEGLQTTIETSAVASLVLTAPVGIVSGDFLFLSISTDKSGSVGDHFQPIAGWTLEFSVGNTNADAPIGLYSRIADGTEGSTVTATFDLAVQSIGYYGRITGQTATTPLNIIQGRTDNTFSTVNSVTTTADDCLIIAANAFDGNGTPFGLSPMDWTKLDEQNTQVSIVSGVSSFLASRELVTAGATGDITVTSGSSNGTSSYQMAIEGAPGGGNDVILDVDNGALSLSGSDVLFMASRIEQALNGNYSLSGSNINFSIGYAISLNSGIYSLSGSATGLVLNANTVIESGKYSLAGTQANLNIARKSIIESGSYNLTGSDVTLIYTPGGTGESLFIDSGAFSLTGSDIDLKAIRKLSLYNGSYELLGSEVKLTFNGRVPISNGQYSLTGENVGLFANRVIIAAIESYTLSGTSVILKYSGDTYKTIGTVTAGFATDRYSVEYKPNTITVNFKD
jgi:hypothetical protein